MYKGLKSTRSEDDSIYTGSSGISLLNLHLYKTLGEEKEEKYLHTALQFLEKPLQHLKNKRYTFLCGDAGPLALGAVIYHKLKDDSMSKECIKRLEDLYYPVCKDYDIPNELLYGRVGYIYSLLFIQKHLGPESITNTIIPKVLRVIIEMGRKAAEEEKSHTPLVFTWHDKHYLGAAHGMVGIIFMLLQLDKQLLEPYLTDIKSCIDHLLSIQLPSGNFPSSLENKSSDKLVHWCHGAPGWIHMFLKAHELFGEKVYLQKAKQCSEVIWLRGLLKKGYGLCHGIAGNAYGFLSMYRTTGEEKHLYHAYMFATWCMEYGNHGCNTPDRPFSLFEGMAGTIYFLADLLHPLEAKFPAFEL
ncbi:hypothetical protein LOTGIDRAFT_179770 [Lottia gigantea]|uniref:LanC-like protein 2 n=1 Tax=Lottia gigantea TaxID=225164 RepID=V3YYZ9_LOTGI|nr:hypothetical protein LOTGIDRAFT_179770 [Lottia gigantea]ESO83348.1 hypothetical protein LOTGIDRAFT_179770 [Lottia gigantea]